MYKHNIDVFEKLKQKSSNTITKYNNSVFFQISFDAKGAYLRVTDDKNNDINPDYKMYKGHIHNVLKFINILTKRYSMQIRWDNPESKIYIYEYDSLLKELLKCHNIIDSRQREIIYTDSYAKVNIQIINDKSKIFKDSLLNFENSDSEVKKLDSIITLTHDDSIYQSIFFINHEYVLADNKIFKVEDLGENFHDIYLFESEIKFEDLEKFLSLLLSRIDNINILYKDYQIVHTEDIQLNPSLEFEKVDSENNLVIKIGKTVNSINPEFFNEYDISRIVAINDTSKTISISKLIDISLSDYYDETDKILAKYKRNYPDKSNYYLIDNAFIIEEKTARDFVYKEMHYLVSKYVITGLDKLDHYNVKLVTPKLQLALNHGIDFLEGDANLEIEGETLSLYDVMNSYNNNSYVTLSNGVNAIINKSYIDRLRRLFKRDKNKLKVSFFDLPIIEDLIDKKIASEFMNRSREIFMGFNRINEREDKLPDINAQLRHYQEQGFKWLRYLYENSLGGCLADDMGLGKTIQTISLLSSIYPEQELSSLIIMPKSLLFNWENEVNKFNPKLSYYTYYGTNRDIKEAKTKNLIFTTYSMLRNEIDKFRDEDFFYVVLDESQSIKNSNSQVSRAVMFLKAKYRLSLSGTPIENNLGELYSLFRFLNPAMFGSLEEFNKYYAFPIQKENNKEVSIELRKKVYPFILRRLKKEVLKELPDKIEQTLYVEMSNEQKEFYEQRRNFYYRSVKEQIALSGVKKTQFYILQALSELRQIASIPESKSDGTVISPKREVLVENILDVIANDHKVLVFANFLNALDLIAEDLDKENIKYLLMTGATRDRKDLIDKFQNNDEYKVFLMTLKTGGLGLNLTAADYIFIFDPWWNKSAENQAIDRAHRIGQDKTVFSYKLITKGTIEEKILLLQEKKMELFESIISQDSSSLKSLDENDVDFILGS
ncbi:MAG: DEAD/DEAH box helicase [Candidatus Sericytochromatia bacterium]